MRRAERPALFILLVLLPGAVVFGQPVTKSPPKVVVESSTGRAYLQREPSGWSSVYSGRSIAIGRTFVASNGASMRLTVGELRLEVLPITVAAITEVTGGARDIRVRIRVDAGALRVIQPAVSLGSVTLDCSFGVVTGTESVFLLDGNRVSVTRGKVHVVNTSGNRRTILAGEELIVPPRGFLPQPALSR